jgi:hypothetical protein
MKSKRIECFFIEDIKKFMIFVWKNIFDHSVRFITLFEMLFYVSQNDRKKTYVLSFTHHVERRCFDHCDIHFWQFLFRVKDFRLELNEFKISNRLRIFDSIDWFCRFFVFSKKINRWLIKTNFFSKKNFDDFNEFSRVLNRFIEFEVIWLIQKRFLFERNVLFFVYRFYCSRFYLFRMRAEFWEKFDNIRFFVINDVMLSHSWFVEY